MSKFDFIAHRIYELQFTWTTKTSAAIILHALPSEDPIFAAISFTVYVLIKYTISYMTILYYCKYFSRNLKCRQDTTIKIISTTPNLD